MVKVYRYSMFVGILLILGLVGFAMNSLVELCLMLSCFLISKQFYRYKYHCNSSLKCLLLSVGVFVVGLRVTLPAYISYACSGVCGLLIAYIGQYAGESKFIREDYAYIEPRYNELIEHERRKDILSKTEAELREYCNSEGLDPIESEIVIQRLIYHLKGRELYDKIGYSKPQMIRKEHKIENILKISLK